jgi:hypothetical protein
LADHLDAFTQIECCIWNTVYRLLLEDPILRPPKYGSPSHPGPDFCCDALYVHMGPSNEYLGSTGVPDKCSHQMEHDFIVTLAIPACSEGRLGEAKPCEQPEPPCASPAGECFEPDPKIGDKCSEGNRPTVMQETAYINRARMLLTNDLACQLKCCFMPSGMQEPCADLPCDSIRLVSVTGDTEGGCAYIELTLRARW